MTPGYACLDADSAALSAAGAAAEEALSLHRQALAVLEEGWQSESGTATTDLIRRQCAQAAELVDALHGVAAELRELCDTVGPLGPRVGDAQRYDAIAARFDDRAEPRFQTPTAPPLMSATPSAFPSWTPGAASLPNIGGTVAGLVAQIAGALSADADVASSVIAEDDSPSPAPRGERPALAVPAVAGTTVAAPERVSPTLDPPAPIPAEAPPTLTPTPVESQLPQQEPVRPPAADLLAAERPVQPQESPPDAKTPCEIAADALPQVGE